jgi:hypothetical protein
MNRSGDAVRQGETRKRARWWALAAAVILAALALGSVEGVARQQVTHSAMTQPIAVRALVRFEALTTNEDGPTGQQQLESRRIQAAGSEVVTFLVAGDRDAPTLCDAGFSLERPEGSAYYLWRFDTRVVAATEARTTLAVSWTRWRQGERDGSGTRTITLEPGDYHILDFVPAPAGSPSSCANLEIRLTADPVPQDEPRPELTYDLWLTQEGPLGPRWSHRQVRGRSSDLVTFTLNPLAWSVRGVALPDTADRRAVRLGVKGTFRATLDPTGFVDVSVKTDRTLTWCGHGGWDGGRQSYRARLGEAVALVLPDPATTAEVPVNACADAIAPAVQLKGANAVLDFGRFFSGNHASLTIVISRARPAGRVAGR